MNSIVASGLLAALAVAVAQTVQLQRFSLRTLPSATTPLAVALGFGV